MRPDEKMQRKRWWKAYKNKKEEMRKRRIWELKESSQNETKAQDKARRLRRKRTEVKKRDETSHSFQALTANKSLTKQKLQLLDFVFLLVSGIQFIFSFLLLVVKAYESSFNWTWREEQMFKSIWERKKWKKGKALNALVCFSKDLCWPCFDRSHCVLISGF